MDRDAQPSSPWRLDTDSESDDEALLGSGGHNVWPDPFETFRAKQGLSEIRRTLRAARPPQPRASLRQRELREHATG